MLLLHVHAEIYCSLPAEGVVYLVQAATPTVTGIGKATAIVLNALGISEQYILQYVLSLLPVVAAFK